MKGFNFLKLEKYCLSNYERECLQLYKKEIKGNGQNYEELVKLLPTPPKEKIPEDFILL